MAAQAGDNIALLYGSQGSQQAGDAIVLGLSLGGAIVSLRGGFQGRWGASRPASGELRAPTDPISIQDVQKRGRWVRGTALGGEQRGTWLSFQNIDPQTRARWGRYEGRPSDERRAAWVSQVAKDKLTRVPWGRYEGRPSDETRNRWRRAAPADRTRRVPWGGPMLRPSIEPAAQWYRGRPSDLEQWIPWTKYSRQLNPGWGIPNPPGDPGPIDGVTTVVPVQRVYIMINETSLRRVSDSHLFPTLSMGFQIDADSWTWGFSAEILAADIDAVQPDGDGPITVEAVVNGYAYRFIVEKIQHSRSFGRKTLRVSGRGINAVLDSPYAPTLNHYNEDARTAAQLIDDALSLSGVTLGWTVDFNLTDWLVPAGAWSHQGSHMSAVQRIAAAAGGYVQPHPTDEELSVLLRYPVMPWDWAADVTPDFELPADIVSVEGIEWLDRAAYNRVYVSGQKDGVLCRVTVEGTAGDVLAPMVTDALITTADAGRQRGMAILGDTGRQAMVSLKVPVLEATGVIQPGKFVRYVDGATVRLGIVRSTSVSVGSPEVSQTLGVETHVS